MGKPCTVASWRRLLLAVPPSLVPYCTCTIRSTFQPILFAMPQRQTSENGFFTRCKKSEWRKIARTTSYVHQYTYVIQMIQMAKENRVNGDIFAMYTDFGLFLETSKWHFVRANVAFYQINKWLSFFVVIISLPNSSRIQSHLYNHERFDQLDPLNMSKEK